MTLAATPVVDILLWAGLLIGAIVVMLGVIAWIRRRLRSTSHPSTPPFTLHDLRSLHAQGRLTDEEFERAKHALLSRWVGNNRGLDGDDSPRTPGAPPDAPARPPSTAE